MTQAAGAERKARSRAAQTEAVQAAERQKNTEARASARAALQEAERDTVRQNDTDARNGARTEAASAFFVESEATWTVKMAEKAERIRKGDVPYQRIPDSWQAADCEVGVCSELTVAWSVAPALQSVSCRCRTEPPPIAFRT